MRLPILLLVAGAATGCSAQADVTASAMQALGTAIVKASVTEASIVGGWASLSRAVKSCDIAARAPYLSFPVNAAPSAALKTRLLD